MKNIIQHINIGIYYFFILLFCYAATSKMMDFENFQVQIAQSPLLSAYTGFISYVVIIAELLICILLVFPQLRLLGLYASLGMMSAFSVYIFLILNYSDFVPCSCGGILEKMSWTEHLIFNIVSVLLALCAIVINHKTRPNANIWEMDENEMDKNRRQIKSNNLWLIVRLCFVTLVSSAIVVSLFFSSEYIIKKENNFTRRFPQHIISEDRSFNLKVNSYYFVGHQNHEVYLGNPSSPFRILKVDAQLQNVDSINLIPTGDYRFKNLRYQIREDYLYAYDGSVPIIYITHIDSLRYPLHKISSNDVYFDQFQAISPSQFMLRVEDRASKKLSLAKLALDEEEKVYIDNTLLTEKTDGGFDADGRLLYDTELQKAYYLYYYRNRILILNSSLQLLSKMKTIDTISKAALKVKSLKDGRKKMTEPALIVNKNMITHKGLIFNESNLLGKFESKDFWRKNAVIDVYNTESSNYWGSFYVKNRGTHKMSQMLMTDLYFYILSGDEIVRYRCAQTLTDQFINGSRRKPLQE